MLIVKAMTDKSEMNTPNPPLWPVYLTIFIDVVGLGIAIPILAPLFFSHSASIFEPAVSESTRSLLYGLLLAVYPIAQFFGAPILGGLSD